MKLIAGLGNPGREYRDTRHNVGFMVADALADRWRLDDQWRERFDALQVKRGTGDESVLLAKPLTFMNLSGESVSAMAGFYKIAPADVFVIVDEAEAIARLLPVLEALETGTISVSEVEARRVCRTVS